MKQKISLVNRRLRGLCTTAYIGGLLELVFQRHSAAGLIYLDSQQ